VSLVVLLGGARAGKSALALELAARWEGPVTYIATGEARDEEMAARIERHRSERDVGWETIEEPTALVEALRGLDDRDAAVVDCLTLWVANLLEREVGEEAIMAEANAAADLAASRSAPGIIVTNEVGLGIVPHTTAGRAYRDLLGSVNSAFVRRADEALLVVAGRALQLDRWP
jgi:adenosylcobinamide kinase / adenosylcobinamide-phosphate guanylyltransferase